MVLPLRTCFDTCARVKQPPIVIDLWAERAKLGKHGMDVVHVVPTCSDAAILHDHSHASKSPTHTVRDISEHHRYFQAAPALMYSVTAVFWDLFEQSLNNHGNSFDMDGCWLL
jgi:hypothetical protein